MKAGEEEGSESSLSDKESQENKTDKQHKNKGSVSEDKMKNKRQYKEARKKLKMKKKQGVMNKPMQQNAAAAVQIGKQKQ